jgi:hypothetical protein
MFSNPRFILGKNFQINRFYIKVQKIKGRLDGFADGLLPLQQNHKIMNYVYIYIYFLIKEQQLNNIVGQITLGRVDN